MNYLFKQGMRNVWTNRIMSVASLCILSVSLLLIGFTLLFVANINRFVSGIENKNEVVIFIEDGTEETEIAAMATVAMRNIQKFADNGSVRLLPKSVVTAMLGKMPTKLPRRYAPNGIFIIPKYLLILSRGIT